jgi:Chaperone of endosialidase
MEENTTGSENTAMGDDSLDSNTTGSGNTAVGKEAGNLITTGSNNVCIGHNAGIGITVGSSIIAIGVEATGQFANIGPTCFIGAIDGEPTSDPGSTVPVLIDSNNNLGTFASSRRVKHDIKPMDKASDVILALKPVSFKYNHDVKGTPCFGLIAEEVAQVDPDLVVRNKHGEPWTVRYEQINAMLLNEFLKEHRRVEHQQANITELKSIVGGLTAQLKEQAAEIQKVGAQIEAVPRMVANKP